MAQLTQQDINEISRMINSQSAKEFMADLAISVEDMAYQGFDPRMLISILYSRGKTAGKEIADITKDLNTVALIATTRGSSIQKITAKSNQRAAEFLNMIRATYLVVDGRPRTNKDATLPRIAAMFAAAVSIALKMMPDIRTTVDPMSIHPSFPKYMCMSNFCAQIPRQGLQNEDLVMLTHAFCYHQYRFDRIIKRDPAAFATKDVIRNYVTIQVMSDFYTDQQRLTTLANLNLISTVNGRTIIRAEPKPAIQAAANAWEALEN